jgi:hypothetical protein
MNLAHQNLRVYGLCSFLLRDEIYSLDSVLGKPLAGTLLSFALTGWACQTKQGIYLGRRDLFYPVFCSRA